MEIEKHLMFIYQMFYSSQLPTPINFVCAKTYVTEACDFRLYLST